ncbi:MAG: HPr family phosphocarrier protein [Pseudomonadota bacterium]
MSDPLSRDVVICNRRGLHARASAKFCALAAEQDAVIRVRKDDMEVGGCSIMGLLMLGAGKGSTITLTATGKGASAALDALAALIENRFHEED